MQRLQPFLFKPTTEITEYQSTYNNQISKLIMCYIITFVSASQHLIEEGLEHYVQAVPDNTWQFLLADEPINWEYEDELPINLRSVDSADEDELEDWIADDDSDDEIIWTDDEFDASTIDGDGDSVDMVQSEDEEEDGVRAIMDYAQATQQDVVRVLYNGVIVTYHAYFDDQGEVHSLSVFSVE